MKIQADIVSRNRHKVDSYGAGHIVIGGIAYRDSVLLTPDQPAVRWPPDRFADLAVPHFEMIADAGPEIVILGTGRDLQFPAAGLLEPLTRRAIGLEVMDTGAACRSYNFLLGEDRRVAMAVLMIEAGQPS